MKKFFFFVGLVAIYLPLSVEAKPINQSLGMNPLKGQFQSESKSSFVIGSDTEGGSLKGGLIRFRAKDYRLSAPMTRGNYTKEPRQLFGLVFSRKF